MLKPTLFPLTTLALLICSASAFSKPVQFVETKPVLVSAINYHQELEVSSYYVSEKLDGIRAIWTGSKLVTRSGRVLNAPDWFISELPDISVEGELWAGRGQFSKVQRTVLDTVPNDEQWQEIQYMLFDAPGHIGKFEQRYQFLTAFCQSFSGSHLKCVEQMSFDSHKELQHYLESLTSVGSEGLMLKQKGERYHPGRNASLVKVKNVQDAEAIVVGYKPGKGKYEGKMGAILVELSDGARFYIGSGFSDVDRSNPPKLGDTVTFKHNGWTVNGIPRFARYHRIRLPE
ncbi:DNA ligase [Vibrio methylphosphonaticus]|uniref:DNA ligase n=1 Tax=Vibrio methylphosphonaticus TaxID=2946866 RepID=UPI00202A5AC6|nr:DNA ligase [Vibrio methylphosphonaticus]MCL9774949.1 DNA ligase [Vibrio methylphosphonaticus]